MKAVLHRAALALALLLPLAPVAAQAATTTVPDTIEQRVAACIACHGREGATTSVSYTHLTLPTILRV